MKKTLRTIAATLIGIGRKESFSTEEAIQLPLPDPSGPFEPSPMKEMAEDDYEDAIEDDGGTIRDEATPEAREMPYATAETGKSPKAGRGIDSVDKEFEERCQQCLGIYFTKLIPDPDGGSDRGQRTCTMCGRKCNTYCNGCNRVLCSTAPQDRKVRVRVKIKPHKSKRGKKKKTKKAKKKKKKKARIKLVWKKVPRNFYVNIPKLGKDGKVMMNSKGPIFTRQWGEYSCYHIAHQEAWKQHLFSKQSSLISQVHESEKSKTTKKKSKRAKKD